MKRGEPETAKRGKGKKKKKKGKRAKREEKCSNGSCSHKIFTCQLSLSQRGQVLRPTSAPGNIQIGCFAQATYSIPGSCLDIVIRSAVHGAPVVPNRQVIFAPLEPHLRVVIVGDEAEEVGKKKIRLVFGDAVDALCEAPVYVERVPSSDG